MARPALTFLLASVRMLQVYNTNYTVPVQVPYSRIRNDVLSLTISKNVKELDFKAHILDLALELPCLPITNTLALAPCIYACKHVDNRLGPTLYESHRFSFFRP